MIEDSPRLPPPPAGIRSLIDTAEALAPVVSQLQAAPVIGVDVEAGLPPRERRSRFALLQIAMEGVTVAIDPLRLRDLSSLAPIFTSERILKVFHGIALDREMLEGAGLPPRHVVDLSDLARSAFGKGEASLAALSRRAFGIGMDKSLQRGEWLHRPLTLPMLAYAWRDAELTLALYHWASQFQPRLLALHTVMQPRPEVPAHLPEWLRAALVGSRVAARDLLAQAGLDVDRDAPAIVEATGMALAALRDPLLRSRVIRLAGELELFELTPTLLAALAAPAAPERAAAARALAALGERGAEPAIGALLDDVTQEVREAAAAALALLPARAAEIEALEMNPTVVSGP